MLPLVLKPPFSPMPPPRSPYEEDAVRFCEGWLRGQTTFELRTSGSTGTPKPILLTRSQMIASARLTGQTFGIRPGDHALVCLNVSYVAGVMMLVRGLELGLKLTVVEPTANPLTQCKPGDDGFDFAAFVPLQMQILLESPDESLPQLNRMKAILVGGASVDPALEKSIQAIGSPVYSTYGMTETVSHVAIRRLNGPDASDVYTALDGVALNVDSRSCLNIRAAATDFVTIQTNDVVELLDANRFRLLGRADSIINTGGVKVQPETVEKAVGEWLAERRLSVRQFVAGLPEARLGQQVTLFIEDRPWPEATTESLKNFLRSQLSAFACPREIIFVSQFRQTPTGKIDRRATIEQLTA